MITQHQPQKMNSHRAKVLLAIQARRAILVQYRPTSNYTKNLIELKTSMRVREMILSGMCSAVGPTDEDIVIVRQTVTSEWTQSRVMSTT